MLRRGPYLIASGLDESLPDPPHRITGRFIDLFDAQLPIVTTVTAAPGSRHLLLDLDRVRSSAPAVLAGACKTLGQKKMSDGSFRFYAEGPDKITASVRLLLAAPPKTVLLDDHPLPSDSQVWDAATRTLLLRFPNAASGHWITVR